MYHNASLDYHEAERRIALDASDPRHLIPDVEGATAILDIGCGVGQTLAVLPSGRRYAGIDIDEQAVHIAQVTLNGRNILFAVGCGENLPFQSSSFDCRILACCSPIHEHPAGLS
jgi:SAM-dependent methyltransferase